MDAEISVEGVNYVFTPLTIAAVIWLVSNTAPAHFDRGRWLFNNPKGKENISKAMKTEGLKVVELSKV